MHKAFYIGFNGKSEAYIYIWYSKKFHLVYVGQTNKSDGVIGRACQHINEGTLYKKLYEIGYNLYNIDDFVLLSFPLPREERKFMTKESSYRLSVEYLVQTKLHEKNSKLKNHYRIISKVDPSSEIDKKRIIALAEDIANQFIEIYEED